MIETEEKVILPSDPEAARLVSVTGWVSRDGRFWGDDERTARDYGATHRPCNVCGVPVKKPGWTVCGACHSTLQQQRYDALPRQVWDGSSGIYSSVTDRFYWSIDEAIDDLEDQEADGPRTLADLCLVLCEPAYAHEIDMDTWCDELPRDDEGQGPGWLEDAIRAFNEAIKDKEPLSWLPGKIAVDVSAYATCEEVAP